MSDLVEELREVAERPDANYPATMLDAAARIEALEAEVKVWQGHTKMAVWSDSAECKVLTAEVERLLKSRNRWATKYNDLLEKRRAEDGYDVYAAAREEYRKKISEQADRIEALEAALRAIDEQFSEAAQDDCENGVRWLNKRSAEKYLYEYPHTSAAISFVHKVARAALEEKA